MAAWAAIPRGRIGNNQQRLRFARGPLLTFFQTTAPTITTASNSIVLAGMPFCAAAGGVHVPRTFWAATSRATYHARAGLRRQYKSPLLLSWCPPRSAGVWGYSSNQRRDNSIATMPTTHSSPSDGRRRAISAGSWAAFATAGPSSAGETGVTFVTTDAAVRRNADPGSVAFVTGANRGIGLEVTRQLLVRTKGE